MSEIGYVFCNGLGKEKTGWIERLAQEWWRQAGVELIHHQIDWYDGATAQERVSDLKKYTLELLARFGGVALIGSSASGQLVINTVLDMDLPNVCGVSAHGRTKVGDYPDRHRMSLHHRAHLDTDIPAQSFADGVVMLEKRTPSITKEQFDRILVLAQLTDLVVPSDCRQLEGATTHRSLAFGHSGGAAAHMFADRDMIIDFANRTI